MITTIKDIIANFYLDGNYAFEIWRYLHKEINFEKLIEWVLRFIKALQPDTNPVFNRHCSRCFMGESAWIDVLREEFLHQLLKSGISSVRRPLKFVDNNLSDGKKGYKEDANDITLVAHAFYDIMVSPIAKETPPPQYNYLVLIAGDSDFAACFDLLKAFGIKIIVLYYDVDKIKRPTSDLIIKSADYAISLESLMYDRKDALAQAIFKPIHPSSSTKLPKFQEKTPLQLQSPATETGSIKFIDAYSNSWGIIETGEGDYHFSMDSVKTTEPLNKGQRVKFTVVKRPLPNDGSVPKSMSNGKATDILIDNPKIAPPSIQQKSEEKLQPNLTCSPTTSQISEADLKKLVAGCAIREGGFRLLSEVGAAYKFLYGDKPERPLKEMFADYPSTFEICNTPAASVRIIG